MLFEFCAENLTDVAAALDAGAGRIELCDNLAVGGTTPSLGVIEQAVSVVRAYEHAEVRVIIRPRGGDFVYGEAEFKAMETDIRMAAANGVDGVVIGCLKARKSGGYMLDKQGVARLIGVARSAAEMRGRELGITFHMAFDAIEPADQHAALDDLIELGVDRVLTHGAPPTTPIEDGLERLRSYIAHVKGRLVVLPGGGITYDNAGSVAAALGVEELHGTRIVRLTAVP